MKKSVLNEFCYFQNNPAIIDLIRIASKNHEKIKAWVMDEEQVCDFMTQAPNDNRYWLVRKVYAVMNIYGGLRGAEMRELKREKIKSVTKGYKIEYLVSKNLTEKKWNT